jgi:cytochrome b subunit of formate dehydrogenase
MLSFILFTLLKVVLAFVTGWFLWRCLIAYMGYRDF